MIGDPPRCAAAVVEPGGKRVRPQTATAVAELDPDHHEAGGRELVTPSPVARVGRSQQHHAAAVGVHDAGQRSVTLGGLMDVQRDLVAVDARDRLRPRGHAGHRRQRANIAANNAWKPSSASFTKARMSSSGESDVTG